MTPEEQELDDWVLSTLKRREGMVTDIHDFFTSAAIDSKWGADTPRAISNSNTCGKNLDDSLARLVAAKLIRVRSLRTGQDQFAKPIARNYTLTDPLEQFTRQVHQDS